MVRGIPELGSFCPHRVLPSVILAVVLGFSAGDTTDPSRKMPLSGEPGKVAGVRVEPEWTRDGESTRLVTVVRS